MKKKPHSKEYLKKWRQSEGGKKCIQQSREKRKEAAKAWAKEYYKKNKIELLEKRKAYRKAHPEVDKKSQAKCRQKNIERNRKDRAFLKPHYVNTLIKHTKQKSDNKDLEVLFKRVRKSVERSSDKKICKRCLLPKEKLKYRIHSQKKDGSPVYNPICNECVAIVRKGYKLNKEKQAATNKRYYEKNKEKIAARQKQRRQKQRYEKHNNTKKSFI